MGDKFSRDNRAKGDGFSRLEAPWVTDSAGSGDKFCRDNSVTFGVRRHLLLGFIYICAKTAALNF